ncbi:MAG TPA: GNAT family N-acetyltransferase [Solirubrobacteraceae bacterium]|jgi:GNAT superfamily N-acetyltransferase
MADAATQPPVEIRPIEPDDKQALREGFERLSERSRYRRFLAPHGTLSAEELRYFTEVDHHDHEALVAIDPESGEGVGVARYVRLREDPALAEMAVAVLDDWQGQGVGSRLVLELAKRARSEGIRGFTALLLAENNEMLGLMRELGDVHVLESGLGTVNVTVALPETGLGRIPGLVRALAAGRLTPARRLIRPPSARSRGSRDSA